MDIRKYFNVEVTKNKESVFPKEKSTTDGSKPFIEYTETKTISQKPKIKQIVHKVFTDGSTFNNGQKNMTQYGGIGVFFKDDDERNICKILKGSKITNNVAELTAILLAIETIIKTPSFVKDHEICIYSDSEYCINCITKWAKGWKNNNWMRKNKGKLAPVKNKNLIEKIFNYYNIYKIRFTHVRSHQPEPYNKNSDKYKIWYGNHMADKYATHASTNAFKNDNSR